LVAMIQVGFLVVQSVITDGSTPSPKSQVIVTLLAIVFAAYLYCFRFATWEKGVEVVREADDRAVHELVKSAEQVTVDDKGVKL